jgi:hypothetical protein
VTVEWHMKAPGRYRTTIHRNAWVEVARTQRYWQWAVYGIGWPKPKRIIRIAGPFRTMRDAKAAAESRIINLKACDGTGRAER